MQVIRIRARVTGLVQGVFYRASTEREARTRGLTGWVRNCDDGAVELEAEGPAERVDDLIAWCRRGPAAARVAAVDVEPIDPIGDREFRVRR
ncbi:MAG TPA: acylphosphatase [Kofleriaceae bacterium]|jgi:acylphosphatase|nr:acylphosphatase [Kofleriaceae bacterium]